jgi:ubiquinone/menaquinone biosynthesis C-methylase UbiE
VFSTDPSELARARKWEDTILANSEPAEVVLDRYGQVARPEQPLAVSAAKMAELAARHCKGSYLSQMSCRWYHGSWQYLRLVNVVSTPDWHFDFYKRSVGEAARLMPVGKILICGMADYGMLAHLLADLSSEQRVKYEITALDLCATPLRICEWFAERQSVELRTLEEDALDMGLRDSWFGLILTDAFLSRFTDRERKEVVAEWRRVLAPGGFVVTTARVEETSEKVVGSAADVSAFVERARNAALELRRRNMLPCSIEDIETMASEYAQKIVSYPLTSDELQTLFAGFEMTHERSCTPGEFGQTSYARIVARKPAR